MYRRSLLFVVLLLLLALPVLAASYTIEELPAPLGGESRVAAMNSRGDVAGSVFPVNAHTRAALWMTGKGLRWLGPDSDFDTQAVAINDRLQVPIQTAEPGLPGLLWDYGKTSNLLARPIAINNEETVLYQPPPTGIQWTAMNDASDRLGGTWDGPILRPSGANDLTLLVDTVVTEYFRPYSFRPVALNNRKQALVTRYAEILGASAGTFLVTAHSLTAVGDEHFYGRDLNDAGAVVGVLGRDEPAFDQGSAVLWASSEGIVPLQQRLLNGAGWILVDAVAINNAGQIAGNGLRNGQPRGFRLSPVR